VIELALEVLALLGETLYAGPLMAFAMLLLFRGRVADGSSERVIRVYRAWGPGQGLAMGALILGNAGLYYLEQGAFDWSFDTPVDICVAIQHGVFLLLWISSFHLEIWTLEPCRKLDAEGQISDRVAYERAARRVTIQVCANVLLLVACGGLGLAVESIM